MGESSKVPHPSFRDRGDKCGDLPRNHFYKLLIFGNLENATPLWLARVPPPHACPHGNVPALQAGVGFGD
jgi:hypothetical protein